MKDKRWQELFESADPDLVESFIDYVEKNQPLYKKFEEYTFAAKEAGRERFSIWMIANRIRWYTQVETTGADFKVSNDYLALFARLLIYNNPSLEGMFRLKKMKSVRQKAWE